MNETPDSQNPHQAPCKEETIIQDGVPCPRTTPWTPRSGRLTRLLFIPIIVLPIYILAQTSILKLFIWLLLLGIFAYPLRYLVCARCPYYGQICCTDFGRIVTRMFRKQEGRSMRLGLWLDVVFFAALCLVPLPEVYEWGGILMIFVWLAVFFGVFAGLTRLACSVCPFTFCPIGKAGRTLWGRSA